MSVITYRITPKRLILSLLSGRGIGALEVNVLIAWGKLFDITPAATRVAVGRLLKQQLLVSVTRGKYRLGPAAEAIADTVSDWADAESKITNWEGQWLVVHTSHLGRTDKTALKARERAFRLYGFSQIVTGLWCRPANFLEAEHQTFSRLIALGLENTAVMMKTAHFVGLREVDVEKMWQVESIEAAYQASLSRIQRSAQKVDSLSLPHAARETFLTGEYVIREINADPLLPEEMINVALRKALHEAMQDYSELGRRIWTDFHSTVNG